VQFRFERNEAKAGCSLYYIVVNGAVTNANFIQVLNAIDPLRQKFLDCMGAPTNAYPVQGRYLSATEDLEGVSSNPVFEEGGVGTDSSTFDILPEENAIVIQKRTNLPGRSKRGRVFLPFVPESLVNDSKINVLGMPIFKLLGQAMVQTLGITGVDCQPVHLDKKNGTFHQIVHTRVVNEVCSRRDRRAPKRPEYILAI
jgi:hypothetical protein